jgi:RNA polymerase sigma factor (sigma-70 family)
VSDDQVWRKHRDELVRYATVLVGPSDAEDLLSAVVVRALSSKGSLSALDDPRPYLFRACLNEAKNHSRSKTRKAPLPIMPDTEPADLRPDVFEAVMGLAPQQRAAVYLIYWKDLSVSESAGLMGCRPGTVKRYLSLARNHLRGVLTYE